MPFGFGVSVATDDVDVDVDADVDVAVDVAVVSSLTPFRRDVRVCFVESMACATRSGV